MNPPSFRTIVRNLSFPEAPRWHDGCLWFSDFFQHKVFRVDGTGVLRTVADVPGQPSGLGWLPDNDLLVVSMLDRRILRVSPSAGVSTHADLSSLVNAPCNDMVVAPDGTAYVGNFGFDRHKGEAQKATVLVRVDVHGGISIAAEDLLFPNGGALSGDGCRLYLAESFANQISCFDVVGNGGLERRRTFYRAQGFFPDGLCLHERLGVIVADPISRHVLHLDLEGRVAGRYPLPRNRSPIACAIGGAGRGQALRRVQYRLGSRHGCPPKRADRNALTERRAWTCLKVVTSTKKTNSSKLFVC